MSSCESYNRGSMRRLVILLIAVSALCAQETPLTRLKREAERSKSSKEVTAVHAALRDWIESRLPADKGALDVEFPSLEGAMTKDLESAGLAEPKEPDPEQGFG